MRLPSIEEREYSLDVPTPNLVQSNAVQKALNRTKTAAVKMYDHYMARKNKSDENAARSRLNEIVQEQSNNINAYQNSDEAMVGTNNYSLDSESKIRQKTVEGLAREFGLSRNSVQLMQMEVNREFDGLYNQSMKKTMGFINNDHLANFKKHAVSEQGRALGKISTGEDPTEIISNYAARSFKFEVDNFKGAYKQQMAGDIRTNNRAGMLNIFKGMGDMGKEAEAMESLNDILRADNNSSLGYLKQFLDKQTVNTIKQDLGKSSKIYGENMSKEINQNLSELGKDPDSFSRIDVITSNKDVLQKAWGKSSLIPVESRKKVQNDILSSASRNAAYAISPQPVDTSSVLTKDQLRLIEDSVMDNLNMITINDTQRRVIHSSAREMKSKLAVQNAELLKYDTYSVIQGMYPQYDERGIRDEIKQRGLNPAVMSKENLIDSFSSPEKLDATVREQFAKGTIEDYKKQSMSLMSSQDGKAYQVLPSTSLAIARIDDALAGNKGEITPSNYPPLSDKDISNLKKAMGIDGAKKTWSKHVEPKILKGMTGTAKKMSEQISKGVYKYPMYGNMYKDMMRSRLHYYVIGKGKTGDEAISLSQKDVNEYMDKTYEYLGDDLGFVIQNKVEAQTEDPDSGWMFKNSYQKSHNNKIKAVANDMRRNPQKYFYVPEGASGRIKFLPGINDGDEIVPKMEVRGRWVTPFKKRESGDTEFRFFRGTKEYIKNVNLGD
jgi:hypothetical protein